MKYIGVMSGTSMDGIDLALCEVDSERCTLQESYTHPFDEALKRDIDTLIGHGGTLQDFGAIDHRLGVMFAQAIETFLQKLTLSRKSIEAIGLHGQTLWHSPRGKNPFTLQAGDPSVVATKTQIKTVADFRRLDMARGGEGAPLAPLFHEIIFKNITKPYCVFNLGGIANVTYVKADRVLGYDIGPANVLMDRWIYQNRNLRYDDKGEWAMQGEVDKTLLKQMLCEPFFKQEPPKSIGKERFAQEWLERFDIRNKAPQDIQRTLLELTATLITYEIERLGVKRVLLCGGGAKNDALRLRLQQRNKNVTFHIPKESGWVEAMMMAWLAFKRIAKEPLDLRAVTGSKKKGYLGVIYE